MNFYHEVYDVFFFETFSIRTQKKWDLELHFFYICCNYLPSKNLMRKTIAIYCHFLKLVINLNTTSEKLGVYEKKIRIHFFPDQNLSVEEECHMVPPLYN